MRTNTRQASMNTPLQRRAGPKGLALQRKETGTNPTLQRHEDDELKDMDEG